jgi:hypothetical protein
VSEDINQDSNNNPGRRFLVLGSAQHTRLVDAYAWDSLPSHLNVADYDVVILNLAPFVNRGYARSIDLETLLSFREFARLLFSEASEIVAIGVPSLKIGGDPYQYTTWWLPVVPKCVLDGGKEIRNITSEFDFP